MSISFKWTVTKVQVAKGDLVVKVDLMVTGTDGANTSSATYTRDLVRGDIFIPFNQLTEQQVLDWCFAPEVITWKHKNTAEQSITKHLKNEGEAQVTKQIASQSVQKESEPALPWIKIPA